MTMVTRCPSCNTVFRVTPPQLQARQGKVRCGRCMMVFDGFKELGTLPDQTPAEGGPDLEDAARVPRAAVPDAPGSREREPTTIRDRDASWPGWRSSYTAESPTAAAGTGVQPATPIYPARQDPPATAEPTGSVGAVSDTAPGAVEQESPVDEASLQGHINPRAWVAGSVLLLFALAAQAAYFYRTELASNYPGLKPALIRTCQTFGCSVPLPQRPKLINVEASDLQIIDAARPGMIQLTATLRNHAGYDLAYPALDLVLTNTKDHTLARRIFLPEEYLERGKDPKAGIPANAEITIRLDLDTGDLGAAGFRLDLLRAPAD
jgi:predicted Zn finger-like uncharacterized protein